MGELTADSNIIIWPQKHGDDKDNQLWRSEDGFLINKKSNLVMDIRGGDLLSDKPIVQYDRKITMAHNQRWGFRDGYVYCLADPRLVLDIRGGGSKDGTKVILYKRKDTDNENQQWVIEPYGNPTHSNQGQSGNVPYYPPPQYPSGGQHHQSSHNTPHYPAQHGQEHQHYGQQHQHYGQEHQHHEHQQQHPNNVPYYPPPSGNFGYGPPPGN
ncbi:ricin B lectin domain-containing protein [Choanephora cucurbitarum]|nr:ricin B lectin domain-containing protein [Choanephora cucurbitarum]